MLPSRLALVGAILHPALHALVVLGEDFPVARHHVDVPGHDDARVAPGTAAIAPHVGRGGCAAVGAVLTLAVAHVAHPFSVEVLRVGVVKCRGGEYLRVARPPQSLVALRAVGGDAQEVASLAPPNIAVEPIDVGVATGEIAPLAEVAPDDLPHDAQHLHVGGGRQFGIAETEEGVTRMVGLGPSVTPQDVA